MMVATEDLELDSLTQRAVGELAAHEPVRPVDPRGRAHQIVRRVRRQLMLRDVLTFMTGRLVAVALTATAVLYARYRQRLARGTAVGGERPD